MIMPLRWLLLAMAIGLAIAWAIEPDVRCFGTKEREEAACVCREDGDHPYVQCDVPKPTVGGRIVNFGDKGR